MKKQSPKGLPWLLGALAASLLLGGVFLLLDVSYMGNDDTFISKSFLGYFTGHAPDFHIFLHTFLTWFLSALSTAFPGVAWFSVWQLALLWLAATVLVKSLCQSALLHGRSVWVGFGLGCWLLLLIGLQFCIRISFTTTAALLSAAAVAQILSVDYERATDGSIVRSLLMSLLLLALLYSLRQITALPALAFCGVALAYVAWDRFGLGKTRSLKPLLVATAAVAMAFGVLAGVRAVEIKQRGLEPLLEWEAASGEILDYEGMEGVPPAFYATLGWPGTEIGLVKDWYMLDSNITTEAYQAITAAHEAATGHEPAAQRILRSLDLFKDTDGAYLYALGAMGTVWLLCALGVLLGRDGRKKGARWAALGLNALLTAALTAYLAAKGRLPLRAVMMVVAPASALLWMLLPPCLPARGTHNGLTRTLTALLLAGALALSACYVVPTAQAHPKLADGEEDFSLELSLCLDEYGLENPDLLVIYDTSLTKDQRLFPDYSEGVPNNLVFWGGWMCRTPEYYEQLANYGIDGHAFTSADFLRENVVFACGVMDPPPERLLGYLRQTVSPDVQCDYLDSYGYVHLFQFSIY